MGINNSSDFSDTNATVYVSGPQTVITSQVEAKVGASSEEERQFVRIYNKGANTIYFGPSGVTTTTGEPLKKNQWVVIAARVDLPIFMIVASGNSTVIIQEIG